MNLAPKEAVALVKQLQERILPHRDVEVVLCPPTLDLVPVRDIIDRHKFKLGAQNCHFLDSGPVTGEVSATMLHGLVDYVIIGHSERRAMGETDKIVAKKMAAAVRNGLTPILCIGDTLHDHEHNLAGKVVVDQLSAALANLTAEEVSGIVIAYEPIWSINHGDGHVVHATPDAIRFAYQAIRTTLEDLYGEGGLDNVRLLYGGSTDPEHSRAYLDVEYVDGLLVGNSSLHYEKFAQIIESAHNG